MDGQPIEGKPCMVSLEPHVVIVDNLPDGMSIDDMVNVYAKYGDIQDANIEVVEEGGVRFNRGYIGCQERRSSYEREEHSRPCAHSVDGSRRLHHSV